MTRGQMVFVAKNKNGKVVAYDTTEFNGDMYPTGHGTEVMDILENSFNVEQFSNFVKTFNDTYFKYEEGGDLSEIELNELEFDYNKFPTIDFRDYYNAPIGFSDFLYIKNNTDDYIFIVTTTEDVYILEPGKTCGFYFGRYYETDDLTCDFTKEDYRLHEGLSLYAQDKEVTSTYLVHVTLKVPNIPTKDSYLYSNVEDAIENALSDSTIGLHEINDIEEY